MAGGPGLVVCEHIEEMREFDFLTLGVKSHFRDKGDGHGSKVHPVADLFALAAAP